MTQSYLSGGWRLRKLFEVCFWNVFFPTVKRFFRLWNVLATVKRFLPTVKRFFRLWNVFSESETFFSDSRKRIRSRDITRSIVCFAFCYDANRHTLLNARVSKYKQRLFMFSHVPLSNGNGIWLNAKRNYLKLLSSDLVRSACSGKGRLRAFKKALVEWAL